MKASLLFIAMFALIACRAPQARTSPNDPAVTGVANRGEDPVLQDGTIKKDVTLPPRENRDTLATEYIGMKRQILTALQIN